MYSSAQLAEKLSACRITVCRLVTTLFRNLRPYLDRERTAQIHTVYFGGEAFLGADVDAIRECFSPDVRLINMIGATEYGMYAAFEVTPEMTFDAKEGVPIGYVLDGYHLTVVDEQGREVPDGEAGCLKLESESVVSGYWKVAPGTDSRFSESTVHPGWRAFQTADLVRRDADGCLFFVGRADQQVKLNGQRIELGEIEHQLAMHPCVSKCCALLVEIAGRARLAAAVCSNPTVRDSQLWSPASLRSYLRRSLPQHMVPTTFLFLDAMPLTGNGKIDRRALREQIAAAPQYESRNVPPVTLEEVDLLVIWRQMLQSPDLGVTDNFFEAGGDSLLAASLLSQIAQSMGVEISLATLLEAPTVRTLASELGRERARDQQTYCYQARRGDKDRAVIAIGMRVERLLGGLSLSTGTQIWCVRYPGTQLFIPNGRINLQDIAQRCAAEWSELCSAQHPIVLGFSFGGTFAYALACELRRLGRDPICVPLEPGTPIRGRRRRRTISDWLKYALEPGKLARRISKALHGSATGHGRCPTTTSETVTTDQNDSVSAESWMQMGVAERWLLFNEEYRNSINAYRFERFDRPVELFARQTYRDETERFWNGLGSVTWHLCNEATEHEDM
ncbi:MAG: non-ribosomal peptide synthetase, partial [Planctomycetaceae bacterium]|nr:non-ribosomal peptide synthetase [Planctomycetaceae bacterium]